MTWNIKNHLIWIVRCYRVVIKVIQKEIMKFLTLVLANFVDVLIIRHQEFCNNMRIIYKLISLYKLFFTDVILLLTARIVLYLIDISWFNKRFWQLRYASDDSNCLLATLNCKNFGISFSFLHDCKNSKSSKAFLYLKSNFSNFRTFLTKPSP